MIDESDWSRLARYFAGESSLSEANEIRTWIESTPQRREAVERLRELWTMSATTPDASHTDPAWRRLAVRMHVADGVAPVPSPVVLHGQGDDRRPARAPVASRHVPLRRQWTLPSGSGRLWRRMAPVAAVLVAVIALMEWSELDAPSLFQASGSATEREPDREYRTARGQRAIVTLSDGSRVELGPESLIRVRPFRDGTRVVTLEGQAIFDVVHDTARVFLVRTKNSVTEDLGTRFAIRAYPSEERVQVLVTHGKVALRAADAPAGSGTLLGVFDLGILDSAGQTTVRNGVDTTSYFAWTQDRFVFDNAPLSEVLPEIARWFDVNIDVVDPAVRMRRITLNVPANSLRSVLGAATLPLGLRFTVSGRTVVIR